MYKNGIIILNETSKGAVNTKKDVKTVKQNEPINSEWYYAIKWLAIIFMVIDHIPKTIETGWSDETLLLMRMIGRMAMPLFAWEIVQCFHFTKDRKKHLIQLGVLAVISEIPYDRSMTGQWCTWERQNVCFTFLLGWLVVWLMNTDWDNYFYKNGLTGKRFRKAASKLAGVATSFPLFFIANVLHVDYVWQGVGLVFLFEFARNRKHRKLWELIAVMAYIGSMGTELVPIYLPCFFCLIFMWLAEYDAVRPQRKNAFAGKVLLGKPSRMICRYFYPAHLIVLGVLSEVIR